MVGRQLRGPYVLRDRRYVAEWVSLTFPKAIAFYNLRLGQAPEQVARAYPGLDADRYARVWKKTCDAVVITETELILVEGELRRPMESLGELQVYRDLLRTTPELRPYNHLPVRTILLCPVQDPTLELRFREAKVELVVYRPPWVEQYLREVNR